MSTGERRTNHPLIDPEPRSVSGIDCLRVQAMLGSGPDAMPEEADCLLIATHVVVCQDCRAVLDRECPETQAALCDIAIDLSENQRATQTEDGLGRRLTKEILERFRQVTGGGPQPVALVTWPALAAEAAPPQRDVYPEGLDGQLTPGRVLAGTVYQFRVKSRMFVGEFTETYEAEQRDAHGRVTAAVVKIPRIACEMSDDAVVERLRQLKSLLEVHAQELRPLPSRPEFARLVDTGTYVHHLRHQSVESTFVAYEFVTGLDLASHMQLHHSTGDRFTGLQDREEFARWARMLTEGLCEIHNLLILHGDIRPGNILVRDNKPVFVDVGQSLFREVMKGVEEFSEYFYRAPEGITTPSSDLFSLGGVLYFLATGKNPIGFGAYSDKEVLKRQVALKIKNANPRLYQADAGVADVIAMCFRKQDRVQDAGSLLRTIDAFWPSAAPTSVSRELEAACAAAVELDGVEGNSLFRAIAAAKARALREVLENLKRGTFDIGGSANDIRGAAHALLGALSTSGDEFVALALPSFWSPENIGVNGRFLSMTRNAAARGARIRRVFLLEESFSDKYLHQIVSAQLNAMADLDVTSRQNYEVRYVVMSHEKRQQVIGEGKTFGLLVKGGDQIAMFPVFAGDLLVTLRFRSGAQHVAGLKETFESVWSWARPLVDLRLPPAALPVDDAERSAG